LIDSHRIDAAYNGEASHEDAAPDGYEQHDGQRHDAEAVAHFVADEPAKRRRKTADRLALGRHKGDATKDCHCPERDNERMHPQRDDQSAIKKSAECGSSHSGHRAEAYPKPGRPWA